MERLDAGIVVAHVDDEHPVDAMLAEPAPVDGNLFLDGVDELQRQTERPWRELRLDSRDELHEERLERDRGRGPRQDEPARIRP